MSTPGKQPGWLVGALAVGGSASALFAGVFHLDRNLFLLPYGVLVGAFLYRFFRESRFDLGRHFRERPIAGALGAVIAGALVVANVISQAESSRPEGWAFVLAVLWVGVFYGALDALFLSVMPVVATRLALEKTTLASSRGGRIIVSLSALGASLAVTAAYHLGYPEFRGPQVAAPVLGNAILTVAYLLSGSPLATTLAHVAMHVAAVLHGMETTLQLPPHY